MAEKRQIGIVNQSLIARFSTALYPIDIIGLLQKLPEGGWVVPEKRDMEGGRELEKPPFKGNVRLIFDERRMTLGLTSEEETSLVEDYLKLIGVAEQMADPGLVEKIQYLEYRIVARVEATSSPLDLFAQRAVDEKIAKPLRKALGVKGEFNEFGTRITLKGVAPNSVDWTLVTVDPLVRAPHSWFHVDVIHRRGVVDDVLAVSRNAKTLLTDLLSTIEA